MISELDELDDDWLDDALDEPYFVTSPAVDRRQKHRWVAYGLNKEAVLIDWSYGHDSFATEQEAEALALLAKKTFPNRRFRIDYDLDGNAYITVREL